MKIILVFATKRSGHHAVINWIGENMSEPVVFYNNPDTSKFIHGKLMLRSNLSKNDPLNKRKYGKNKPKFKIYNFENCSLKKQKRFLKSKLVKDHYGSVIVIRDIYNTLASAMKKNKDGNFDLIKKMWIEQCREILGETNYVDGKIFVNYNKWFCDRKYRIKKAREIGFKNKDKAMDEIDPHGRGSSFDKTKINARQLDVLNRYKNFLDSNKFNSLLTEELHLLNEKVFGFRL